MRYESVICRHILLFESTKVSTRYIRLDFKSSQTIFIVITDIYYYSEELGHLQGLDPRSPFQFQKWIEYCGSLFTKI